MAGKEMYTNKTATFGFFIFFFFLGLLITLLSVFCFLVFLNYGFILLFIIINFIHIFLLVFRNSNSISCSSSRVLRLGLLGVCCRFLVDGGRFLVLIISRRGFIIFFGFGGF
uniref:Uncharacterized protein n=1 Tax=Cacopsylla melanoneura TaxID=428564 RepID=A0A8D8UUY1_9HEMI